jgi:2-polyprenyl-3-methyl-5-hydroxy-6-metoxy-1,4-benzoquinol methylase
MQIGSREWNDEMYKAYPTPYTGLAGVVERIRASAIRSFSDIKPTDRVLEVGCEAAGLMARLPKCDRLVGVDISKAALADAQQRFSTMNRIAEFIQCDATEGLPFRKGEFSVVICSEMLEHVNEPAMVINNILRICEPSTRIILSVPNEEPKLRLKRILSKIGFMQIFMPGIQVGQSEGHIQAFSNSSFLHLLSGKLTVIRQSTVLGLHTVALCRIGEERTKR